MSDLLPDPVTATCHSCSGRMLTQILEPAEKDLGGFSVRRLLPAAERRAVGPFVFFDHLGPVTFPAGSGIDVRPHPHIGLATVTYLFEGEILHRDSLGSVQTIRPQAINWMTAGAGIVHSERTPPDVRLTEHRLHALQLWVALPTEQETCPPIFDHYPAETFPETTFLGGRARVLVGSAYGLHSPLPALSPTLYVDVELVTGSELQLPAAEEELAIYTLAGRLQCGADVLEAHRLGVVHPGSAGRVKALDSCRLVLIGGASVGPRTVWWNLVASDRNLIEKAKGDWRARRFPPVPGETEFIPLPG